MITCSQANRKCDFLAPFTDFSNPIREVRRVEARRIGFDSIYDNIPTGRFYRIKTTKKTCKYCGNTVIVATENIYV